jgi:hypothetical protein
MTLTTAILFSVLFALLALARKCVQSIVAHVARAKREFDDATRTFKTQFARNLDSPSSGGKAEA